MNGRKVRAVDKTYFGRYREAVGLPTKGVEWDEQLVL